MLKYTFVIGFKNSDKEERIDSNYLPCYVERYGEIFFRIIGKECNFDYYPNEVYIKCIYEKC